MNAVEIEEAVSRLAAAPFDPATFPFALLEAFGNKPTTLKKLQSGSANQSDLPGAVLQRNHIHLKVCAEGELPATLSALRASPATARYKAKFILATDGTQFEAENLVDGETVVCAYADFHDHFGFFLPLAGITTVKQIRENAFDIKATGRLNRLYIELLKENPDWDKAERRADFNHFMARLIFCFFAEDTHIFHGERLFTATIAQMSASDAANTHTVLAELFRAMSTRPSARASGNFRPWADAFPYVNGGLFSGGVEVPRFSKIARSYLLHVGNLDWTKINPDIFGSMIQAVADDAERGALGMHYTSVPNITSVNRALVSLKCYSAWLLSEGCVTRDVAAPVKLIPEVPRAPWHREDSEEEALLATVAAHCSPRDQALITLMLHPGLQAREVCAVRRRDVTLGKHSGILQLYGKRKKYREVPLNATARAVLVPLLAQPGDVDAPLFPSEKTGTALTARGLGYLVARYVALARVADLSPHNLRHRFGYQMAARTPLHRLAQIMSYDSLDTMHDAALHQRHGTRSPERG